MQALTERVLQQAIDLGAAEAGVVGVDYLDEMTPTGQSARKILKKAQSVISFYVPLPRGIVWSNSNRAKMHLGIHVSHEIDAISYKLVRFLEKEGYAGVPVLAGTPMDFSGDKKGMYGDLHLGRVGEAAGIGEVSISGNFISRKYGLAVYLGAIVTDAALAANAPSDPNVYDICLNSGCQLCASSCPSDAIQRDDNGVWNLDVWACLPYAHPYGLKRTLKHIKSIMDEPDPVKQREKIFGKETWELWQAASTEVGTHAGCWNCIMACPIGSDREPLITRLVREGKGPGHKRDVRLKSQSKSAVQTFENGG